MGLDFVMPAVEADVPATPMMQSMVSDMVNMAAGQQANLTSKWLIDGGASCHVVGFDPGAALQRRRRASIEILVGGGQRIKCEHVGDLTITVRTSNPKTLSRLTLKDVRVVPGFGSNLLSAPRMEKAGWCLSQGGGQFKARDDQGRTIFSVAADVRGLYYLNNVTISNPIPPVAKAPTNIRGQRNFLPSMVGNEISKASQFFAMGVKDKNCKVSLLSSAPACRYVEAQEARCDTEPQFPILTSERGEENHSSPIILHPSLHLSPTSNHGERQRERWQGLVRPLGEERTKGGVPVLPSGICGPTSMPQSISTEPSAGSAYENVRQRAARRQSQRCHSATSTNLALGAKPRLKTLRQLLLQYQRVRQSV